jgi:hypothetical protein
MPETNVNPVEGEQSNPSAVGNITKKEQTITQEVSETQTGGNVFKFIAEGTYTPSAEPHFNYDNFSIMDGGEKDEFYETLKQSVPKTPGEKYTRNNKFVIARGSGPGGDQLIHAISDAKSVILDGKEPTKIGAVEISAKTTEGIKGGKKSSKNNKKSSKKPNKSKKSRKSQKK